MEVEDPDKEAAVAGLCASCVFMRRVVSDRGSVFYFCERSVTDARGFRSIRDCRCGVVRGMKELPVPST